MRLFQLFLASSSKNYVVFGLLYHGIIDFTATNSKSAVHTVFNKKEQRQYIKEYSSRMNIQTNISSFTSQVLMDLGTKEFKDVLKEAKSKVMNSFPIAETKIKVVKNCKLYYKMMQLDKENKFDGHLNEVEYTHQFIYPLIKEVLYDCPIKFRLGEPHLTCAIEDTNDDERAQSGPKIDMIMSLKMQKLAISVSEVSGPNFKTNKSHFVGDRVKLAKNMKAMIKYIEEVSPTPNKSALKRIKLYGLQFYKNSMYLYSLRSIDHGYYVFVLERTISIPVSLPLLKSQLPAFFGWLWNLNVLYKEAIGNVLDFIEISNEKEVHEIDSQPSTSTSSQETNDRKRHKRN